MKLRGAYFYISLVVTGSVSYTHLNEEKAKGEALDIRQGVPFCTPCSVYAGSYEDAKDSDIVIITSGIARKPGPVSYTHLARRRFGHCGRL